MSKRQREKEEDGRISNLQPAMEEPDDGESEDIEWFADDDDGDGTANTRVHNTPAHICALEVVQKTKPETADTETQTETVETPQQHSTPVPSDHHELEEDPTFISSNHYAVVEEPKKSLFEHIKQLQDPGFALGNLVRDLGATQLYPDITKFKNEERRRAAVQEAVRNLLTGGLVGKTLSWLPFGGRAMGVTTSQRLLAPLTVMALAEVKFFTISKRKSETHNYVVKLWRATLETDLDCCVTSESKSIVDMLMRIGAKEVKTKNTIQVEYILGKTENLFTGEKHTELTGIKVCKAVVLSTHDCHSCSTQCKGFSEKLSYLRGRSC